MKLSAPIINRTFPMSVTRPPQQCS